MKNQSTLSTILGILFWGLTALNLSAQIDLELNLSATPLVPEAFKNYTFSIDVSNRGSQNATAVKIDIPLPPGFTYQGGNAYSASQGSYDVFFERVWNVGTIPANGSASIDINLYSLQNTNLFFYSQVIAADQTDNDSSPANGTCANDPANCSVQEDDEVFLSLSNAGACSLSASVQDVFCLDPNNSPNPLDDRWSFNLSVTANNAPSAAWTTFSQGQNGAGAAYSSTGLLGDFLISDGPLEFIIQDQQNSACQTNIIVNPPAPCSNSNCSISATTSPPICSDSGTPNDPTDDGFQFILVANGNNTVGNQYRVRVSNSNTVDNFVVNYGEDLLISKFISGGPVQILLTDAIDPSCSRSLTVNPTAPCSTPVGGGIDLELNWSTTNTNPSIYTETAFKLQLQNTGTLPANNVVVKFPAVDDLAYVSHSAAQGSFNNWTGLWEVGNVAAGQSIDLDIRLFTLSSGVISVYAQVETQLGNDIDSTPGNGLCCTANEDDEAVLSINDGAPSICALNALNPTVVCDDNGSSDPGDDLFSFRLNPSGSNLGSSFQLSGGGLSVSGLSYGQSYDSPLLPINAGEFTLTLSDVSGDCSQQVQIVPPMPCSSGGPSPGTDLEISMGSSQSTFSAWQIISITISVSNTGTETASGVALSFPLPDGTVFTGGNEYVATQGNYLPFFEEWELGNLAPGASAGIQFNLFTNQNSVPIVGYSQVIRLNEDDVDSTPGNGSCCAPVEDDEASVSLTPIVTRAIEEGYGGRNVVRNLYPNPTLADLTMVIESSNPGMETIGIYDSRGQLQMQQELELKPGLNWNTMALGHLPAGLYFIQLNSGISPKGSKKFMIRGW